MTASVFAAAARLCEASNHDDLLEPSNDGHMRAVSALATAQAEMLSILRAAGVEVTSTAAKADMQLHMSNPDGTTNSNYDEAILSGLTSKSDIERCFTRAIAGGVTSPVIAWATAELERKTEPAIILAVLMEIATQQVASLAGNFLRPQGRQMILKTFHGVLDNQFIQHAARIEAMLAAPE